MKTNLFITGERGVGKSSLLSKLLEQFNIKYVGFQTLPYWIENERKGFYMHGLVDLEPYENNQPICVQTSCSSCLPITHTFESLGVKVLGKSLEQPNTIIVMDEIGILEQEANDFWDTLEKCLDSKKLVLGVLKQSQHPSLDRIKERKDTYILELNNENRTMVSEKCYEILKNYLKGEDRCKKNG